MGFASSYLEKGALFPQYISEAPSGDTGIIVVVPAYNETGITILLDSLAICSEPGCGVEVLIVINAPSDASEECISNNLKSICEIELWKSAHSDSFLRVFIINATTSGIKGWGVGLARKTGMDEAAARFNLLDRPGGVILNVDADCTVRNDYFTAIYNELFRRKERTACSIYFEHPFSGTGISEKISESIILYELHLRYYFQGLAYSGFPDVHHTVGSAIAVKALPYVKAGGMNRRMAGEDFYFIQKLIPLGGYFNLNSTVVFPSPRSSFRVPFGTGATISRLLEDKDEVLLTYNIRAFNELKQVFGMMDGIFTGAGEEKDRIYSRLPDGFKEFISCEEWSEKIAEIKSNTTGIRSFTKRFFNWFNMFKIVKYMNLVHQGVFDKRPVPEAASELLGLIDDGFGREDPVKLLLYYRKLEKGA